MSTASTLGVLSTTGEPRAAVIAQYVTAYLHTTGTSMEAYADDVAQQYHARTAPELRSVLFHEGGDAYKRLRANGQVVRRFLENEPRMPVDVEEAFIFALPTELRRDLLRELAARVGLLAAPLPDGNGAHDLTLVGDLMREFGDAVKALGPVLADGRIDIQDAPHVNAALREITGLLEQATALRERLNDVAVTLAAGNLLRVFPHRRGGDGNA